MLRFPFVLLFTLYTLDCIFQGSGADKEKRTDLSDGKNAAFTVVREFKKNYESHDNPLPTISKNIQGKWTLSSISSAQTEEIHLCPDISEEFNSEVLNAAYEDCSATRSCLFKKQFGPDEPKICTEEPTPWLTIQPNTHPLPLEEVSLKINCNESNQLLLAFQYNYCDPVDFLSYGKYAMIPARLKTIIRPFIFRTTYPMYEICYDFHAHKTLWTRHQILEPMLIYDPIIPTKNEERIDLDTIGDSTFDLIPLPEDTFAKLKNIYQNEGKNMNAEYLVPMQHMAMQNWKKATHHMINTAPLQERFHQLLHIIDQGLVKASYHAFTYFGISLQIFTAAETKIDAENNFEYNTWYKFIYDDVNKAGTLIYLHNSPVKPSEDATCSNDLHCIFNDWVESEPNIPKEVLAYAGCCKVTTGRVKELFQIDVKLSESLYVDNMVVYSDITDTTLHYLENRDFRKAEY